jgi:hypothetical protein
MAKTYLYALASVPRLGPIERSKLRAVGIRPTFEKDDDGWVDGPVPLRFGGRTEPEAGAQLVRALGSEACLISRSERTTLPDMDGLTSD